MIENNLLKTNFTGKDGFRWWIGQVAPEDAQGSQIQQIGEAWGTRVKVRIFGYHPPDETELANDDLPWAQVLLSPQCGSGKANRGKSLRVSPGDTVMGFFLDGDDAQLPVVMGLFAKSGNPAFGGNEEYTYPFQPFTVAEVNSTINFSSSKVSSNALVFLLNLFCVHFFRNATSSFRERLASSTSNPSSPGNSTVVVLVSTNKLLSSNFFLKQKFE